MTFTYGFGGTITVAPRLPHIAASLQGTVTVAKGATVLIKVGGRLVECRVFQKRDGQLVDAGF